MRNMQTYNDELRDLLRWRRFMVRFGRTSEVMTNEQILRRAQLLASSDGIAQHYQTLREQATQSKPKTWIVGSVISADERKQIKPEFRSWSRFPR